MTKSRGIFDMHGMHNTKTYGVWSSMRARCNNPNEPAFKNYGGRGIAVCDRWSKFSNFVADMGHPPEGMTIERVDNSRGYEPGNCTWVDRTTQGRNKRNNVVIEIDGVSQPLSAWCEQYGIKYATAHRRIDMGWPVEDAVKIPTVKTRIGIKRGKLIRNEEPELIAYLGERMTLKDASDKAGINYSTVCNRIRRGWPLDAALSERPHHGPHSFGARHGVVFFEPERAA